jgi:AcrR family transcriptional regulator
MEGPPSQRRDRGADATKARLLSAAETEFAAKGFDGARLGNIARAAGVQQALIHHYFADKQGLYEEVLARGLAAVTRESWDILSRLAPAEVSTKGGPRKKLPAVRPRGAGRKAVRELAEAFVDVLVRFYSSHSALLAIVHHDMQVPSPSGDDAGPADQDRAAATLDQVVRDSSRPVFEAVVRRIEELRSAGDVRADVDARQLCVSALSMACFPLQEARFLSALWPIDWRDPAVLESRKQEIVRTVLARALP